MITISRFGMTVNAAKYSAQQKLLMSLWICLYIVHLAAFKIGLYPNQVFWAYNIVMVTVLLCFVRKSACLAIDALQPVILYAAYLLCFLFNSQWEVYPGTALRFLPFLVIYCFVIYSFFLLGFLLPIHSQLQTYQILTWLVVLYTFCQLVLHVDSTRLGYGSLSMLLVVFLFAYRMNFLLCLLISVLLASNSVTPLVASIAGIISYIIFYSHGPATFCMRVISVIRLSFLVLIPLGFLSLFFSNKIIQTLGRLSLLADIDIAAGDPSREFISSNAWDRFGEISWHGIGYMNFYAYSGETLGIRYYENSGSLTTGLNLHNSYLTWFLEGGLLVSLAVLVILVLTVLKISRIYAFDRRYGSLLFSFMVVFAVFAISHQLHDLTQFWALIGLSWGLCRRLEKNDPSPFSKYA